MYSRLLNPPMEKSFFLFGPRGTGKSFWVRHRFPEACYFDLLEAEHYQELLASPQRLEKKIPPGFEDWVIIDEVQRIPEILNEVHRLIELKRHRFILTGSSSRKLKRKGVNLLAGRAATLSLHPLTAKELGGDFDLRHSLQYGQLPGVYVEKDPKLYLNSYVKTFLREEVQQESLTRNLSAFSRFLETASFSQGAQLNISSVARECHVERKVVEDYFTILEDLLLATRLPVFTKRAKRQVVAHPKFYFFDVGIFRILRPRGPLDSREELEGAAFESLLFQELRALNDYLQLDYRLHYWRTAGGQEVDFVLYGERGLLAFEVKRTSRLVDGDFKSIGMFLDDYPMARTFLVHGGAKAYWEGKIRVLPLETCLLELPQILESVSTP
ncbi:MAG: ATP-binding protein [Planctomycetes bacterium]|nr:ATP-binding protein [Planctomycetota bacterium]